MSQNKRKKVWSQAFVCGNEERDNIVKKISEELKIPRLLAILLYNRGYHTAEDAKNFICFETTDLHDPYLLDDMEAAVHRIKDAVKNEEHIYIYGDYDVDGVTSVSMLYLYLASMGAKVKIKIPKRDSEGYGVSCDALENMAKEGTTLVITVDTGITAIEEVEYAKTLGIDVVVTDHHECRNELPSAIAVVNPHRPDSKYPFCELAGVGVVFKLLCAYEMSLCDEQAEPRINGVRRICYEYADLAAIGTIADVMPLVNENRLIVNLGLSLIEKTNRKGLAALIEAATAGKSANESQTAKRKKITSNFIGYALAPRINAAGRISDAMIAVRLLLCLDDEKAKALAEELCEINYARQLEENRIAEAAYAMIEQNRLASRDKVIVLADNEWQQGIVGIVSSRITEKYGLPSILISFSTSYGGEELGTDVGKGSGRSIKGMNLVEALGHCEDQLIKFGGHELAAGLTIHRSQVDSFREKINEYAAQKLSEEDFKISITADCEIEMKDVTMELAQSLSMLEPYGVGNASPSFIMRDVTVSRVMPIGGGKHTKLLLTKDGISLYALYFGVSNGALGFDVGDTIDVLFNVDINDFKNVRSVQLIIEDARVAHTFTLYIEDQRRRYEEIRGGARFEESEDVIPSREDFVKVYTILRREFRNGSTLFDEISLFKMLNSADETKMNYVKLRYILRILNEMKICNVENLDENIFEFDVPYNSSKTNIERSSILKKLKSQCNRGV